MRQGRGPFVMSYFVLPCVRRVWGMVGEPTRNFQVEKHEGNEKPDY